MKRTALVEAVTRYVEGADETATQLAATLAIREREHLENLHGFIAKLRAALVPVEPAPEYHDALKARLVASWHQQRQAELARQARSKGRMREFPWRVAAVWSFLPLVALAAYIVHGRTRTPRAKAPALSS